jgi:hypothetical protein
VVAFLNLKFKLYILPSRSSNVELVRGHRKKWRPPGFREGRLRQLVNPPFQSSQRKFSRTHTGVEQPVEGGLALD